MKHLVFNFKDYTPLEIGIDPNDIDSLNILFNYLNLGAKVQEISEGNYFMDMSFEDKPISLLEWIKIKLFMLKLRLRRD